MHVLPLELLARKAASRGIRPSRLRGVGRTHVAVGRRAEHMLPAPFPDTDRGDVGGTSEPLMLPSKHNWQRFGDTGHYRDMPFAVAFVLQLLVVIAIAIANGYSVLHSAPVPATDPDQQPGERSSRMLAVLVTATIVAGVLGVGWTLLLRSGARALIWCGAGGGVAVAFANGIWLLVQGGAAGIVLGTLSLMSGVGCALFIIFNRQVRG